jgi:hypothetical protein
MKEEVEGDDDNWDPRKIKIAEIEPR